MDFQFCFNLRKEKSFTLIELVVVIAIIGLIAGVVLVNVNVPRQMQKAQIVKTLTFSRSIQSALGVEARGIWDFDEGPGADSFADTSGNKNNGSCSGTSCPTAATNTPQAVLGQGQEKYALSFDGYDDYVDAGSDVSLQITSAITLEAWVYQKGSVSNQFAVVYGSNGNYDYGLVWMQTTGKMALGLKIAGVWADVVSSAAIPKNNWVHIVATYDGSRVKIYRNGTLDADNPLTGSITITPGNSFRLGYAAAANHWWNGLIDEVRIYAQALTIGQVQKHYAEGLKKHQNLAIK